MVQASYCLTSTLKELTTNATPQTIHPSLTPTKRAQFEKDSDKLYVNPYEMCFDFLLNILELNTASCRKILQLMYKTMKQVNRTELIAKYKGEDEEIAKANESGITVKVKNVLLNYMEALL